MTQIAGFQPNPYDPLPPTIKVNMEETKPYVLIK